MKIKYKINMRCEYKNNANTRMIHKKNIIIRTRFPNVTVYEK